MDLVTDAPLGLSLTVLALLDGLSIGTLLIPVFLLLAPRLRGGRVLLYLVTIAAFYLVVGVLVTLGLVNLVEAGQGFLNSTPGRIVRLVVGAGLLVASFAIPTREKAQAREAERAHERIASGLGPSSRADAADVLAPVPSPAPAGGRLSRWRDRLLAESASPVNVMAVALAAGLLEVATMLPYLVGMGLVAEAGLDGPLRFAALGGYCVVMIAPALVLLALRVVAAPLVQRPLERLAAWLERTAAENTAWIVGIIGFFVARAAASELGLFAALGDLAQS